MTVITARIRVAPDHSVSGTMPPEVLPDVPPGEHVVRIETPAHPGRQMPSLPFDVDALPTLDVGSWPEGLSLRREDMYCDDGR